VDTSQQKVKTELQHNLLVLGTFLSGFNSCEPFRFTSTFHFTPWRYVQYDKFSFRLHWTNTALNTSVVPQKFKMVCFYLSYFVVKSCYQSWLCSLGC